MKIKNEYIGTSTQSLQLQKYLKEILYLSKQAQIDHFTRLSRDLQYFTNIPEEIQLLIVTKDYQAIQYINDPSDWVQKLAVKQNGNAIKLIKNPKKSAIKLHNELYPANIFESHEDNKSLDVMKNLSEKIIKGKKQSEQPNTPNNKLKA